MKSVISFIVFANVLESSFGWFCDLFCTLKVFHRSLARCPTISADQVCQVNIFENTKKLFFGAIFYLDLNKTCKIGHLRLCDIILTCYNPLGKAVGSVSFALSKCLYI